MKKHDKPVIAVDFDGVLNTYDGWRGEDDLFQPKAGVSYFLDKLHREYNVIVFTVRDNRKVRIWLKKHGLNKYIHGVTSTKPKALAYIDDRAINYDGSYSEVLDKLNEFKVWWQKE